MTLTVPSPAAQPMAGRHLHWGAEALWHELDPLLPGLTVEVVAHADSTNTRLLERARVYGGQRDAPVSRPGDLQGPGAAGGGSTPLGRRTADVQPCLLVAEHQDRGRGRLGRDWVSSPGASLTFSLSLSLQPIDWSGLSLAVGLALAEALDPPTAGVAPRIVLKWPNDLWLVDSGQGAGHGRKLGGVLIETVSVGQHRMCVVGVGLNVLPQPVDESGRPLPAATPLTHGYGCLSEIEPTIDAPSTLARVAAPLVRALLSFQATGFSSLAAAYARRDLLLGQPVSTTLPDVPDGIAEGVDERGALRVRRGAVHHLVSGEVSVRLQPTTGGA